jgi:hypothetical protein
MSNLHELTSGSTTDGLLVSSLKVLISALVIFGFLATFDADAHSDENVFLSSS